ncbi:MAG: LysM peptidoglycan-binding domain-containing protein [Microbacteriaceae bacterium]|nr:LysM peptidoglycan-binding domain-containing protein [Microbacteriaceae bacterium]
MRIGIDLNDTNKQGWWQVASQHFRATHSAATPIIPDSVRAPRGVMGFFRKARTATSLAVAATVGLLFGAGAGSSPAVAADETRDSPHPGFGGSRPVASPNPAKPGEVRPRIHTVVAGDTLSAIAGRYGVSTAGLLTANGLSWKTMIFAGQVLHIPQYSSDPYDRSEPDVISRYRVAAGDSLASIASFYGVQPVALMTANGLGPQSRLVVGQRLVIPNAEIMGDLPAPGA